MKKTYQKPTTRTILSQHLLMLGASDGTMPISPDPGKPGDALSKDFDFFDDDEEDGE